GMFRGRPHARMNRFLRIAAAHPARRRVARCAVWIIPTRRPRSRREAAVRDLVVTPTAKVPAVVAGPTSWRIQSACRPALYAVIGNFVAKAWNGSGLFPDPCGQTAIQ
uniref:Uncharacterized protein n=1 Tax=Aegilops tauschii subsp. strangulata TaxID=200361 RepID=A0A452ZH72_AEGTS